MSTSAAVPSTNINGRYTTDDKTCHYCLKDIGPLTRTVDHIVPRSLGGLDIRLNRIMSCRKCNSDKASLWPTCLCAICKKSRRYHWEHLRIKDPKRK